MHYIFNGDAPLPVPHGDAGSSTVHSFTSGCDRSSGVQAVKEARERRLMTKKVEVGQASAVRGPNRSKGFAALSAFGSTAAH